MTIEQKVGKACREYRIESGYAQAQVARDLGLTNAAICHFEKDGRSSLTILMWYVSHGFDLRKCAEANGLYAENYA